MCRSGTQVELPRRLAMSQVGLVDDHTLHQPCVQSLSFKSTLALWMPAHWTPSLWPTVAIPQRKKWHLPGGRITSGDLPLRTHTRTHAHTHTHTYAYYMMIGSEKREHFAQNAFFYHFSSHHTTTKTNKPWTFHLVCVHIGPFTSQI